MSIMGNGEKINTQNDIEGEEEESEIFDLIPPESRKEKIRKTLIYIAILISASSLSYGIGRVSFYNSNKIPVTIKSQGPNLITLPKEGTFSNSDNTASILNTLIKTEVTEGVVVGSKNSNKYHYPWCSGAKNISDANKITFVSIEEARKAGYIPASNCKGLK